MKANDPGKKYESAKIPPRQQTAEGGAVQALPIAKTDGPDSLNGGLFYEIEYNSSPWEGVGRFVPKPQKIEAPPKDEIRELFYAMREIARVNRTLFYSHSNAYDRRVRQENSRIFYKQALFMKDFVDHYTAKAPYSSPFPSYQMMGYEQLRTYFTWRTQVRQGNVADTSIAYAFLYIYELLNNIGVEDPAKGLDKLMFFWKAFRKHNKAIDKYVLAWLKDYHIYYQLPRSFKEFITQKDLTRYYPSILDTDDSFDLFAAISRYDIGKSSFYSGDNIRLSKDCFHFIIERLRQVFQDKRSDFDETIFQPAKKMYYWQPFKEALFYHWLKPPDRQVVLSENEI
ncbi:MAG: TerB N-terminal domain-containing protein, partial [Clostridiales bacterium]|nr:TerB N-terminal domain-containing protein [Clostridiales bacterium]